MTATLGSMAARKKDKPEPTAEQKLAEELVARAREQGVSLTGWLPPLDSGARPRRKIVVIGPVALETLAPGPRMLVTACGPTDGLNPGWSGGLPYGATPDTLRAGDRGFRQRREVTAEVERRCYIAYGGQLLPGVAPNKRTL